jgi:hypothetical protein
VPRHVARLVTWLVASLVFDYSSSRRLVVDYSASHRLVVDNSASRRLVIDNSASRRLIIDYSVRRDFVLHPRWLYFSHTVRHDYLSRGKTSSTSSTPCATTTSSSGRIASTIHLD